MMLGTVNPSGSHPEPVGRSAARERPWPVLEEAIPPVRPAPIFEKIIGTSPALQTVLQHVAVVAPTDSKVLILGETGTGKELIAEAIYALSPRRHHPFIKMNCAAIPPELLESELFGHEKGAFTGAMATKLGRFERAHQGTLFLDEVGDIPLALQTKLLRVLQEQEFERLGGTRTQRVDVRVVAATNRDLAGMVAAHQFRADLYYRLSVFPLAMPPLRERAEDIPPLVTSFVRQYAQRMNKPVRTIPAEVLEALTRYAWPGNVRELQNFIERSVILSSGAVLRPPLAELRRATAGVPVQVHTLAEAEREHIRQALDEARWVIGGPRGAAQRLGVKRTTLLAKMRRLGLTRPTAWRPPGRIRWSSAFP